MHVCRLLLAVALAGGLASQASAQVTLEWKLKEGDRFYQETITTVRQSTRVAGQEQKLESTTTTVSSFVVRPRTAEGNIVLRQKIESVKTERAGEKGPEPEGVRNFYQSLKGAEFTITMKPDFKVEKFEGYDELISSMTRDDPNAGRVLRALLPMETLRDSAAEAFAFLPKGQVRPGSSWERDVTASLGPIGTILAKHKYTYEGPDTLNNKTLQKIAVEAKVSYRPTTGDAGVLPFQITRGDFRVDGGSGTLWFDAAAGRLVESQMKMRLKGNLAITAGGQDYMLELDQDQTVQIRITDQPPAGS